MAVSEQQDASQFDVVVNAEQQYSIWSSDMTPPAGWERVGVQGPRQACLDYINRAWTDMRPLSLRRQMDLASTDAA